MGLLTENDLLSKNSNIRNEFTDFCRRIYFEDLDDSTIFDMDSVRQGIEFTGIRLKFSIGLRMFLLFKSLYNHNHNKEPRSTSSNWAIVESHIAR